MRPISLIRIEMLAERESALNLSYSIDIALIKCFKSAMDPHSDPHI